MAKKIVVIIRKPPHGTLYPAEGLRVAVAVSTSEATVVTLGDGVYTFLKETDKTLYQRHLDFLKDAEIPIIIDKESLEERGLKSENLIEQVTVKEREEVLKILAEADVTLTF